MLWDDATKCKIPENAKHGLRRQTVTKLLICFTQVKHAILAPALTP